MVDADGGRGAGVHPAEGLHRLDIQHSVANSASCRVAEKAGFTYEGTLRSSALHTDGWHDMHLHARVQGDV
ncbi:GNAT family protein [Amycolatopsis sp.]|uniref:GNAT family N-acetyltransferase n=1 Tax=Amycolatopsis sp. TaxID=37632 RepID=UPI002614DA93|nr:GNAT family protein [Amycolatopsis sp.]